MAKNRVRVADMLFEKSTLLCACAIAGTMVVIVVEMLRSSRPSMKSYGWSFLWTSTWDPIHEKFGALPSVYGTVVSSLIALLVSVPLSIGIAVFLTEHAPRKLRTPAGFVVQLLAAIPSVVYGMWGIFVLAPLLRNYLYPPLQSTLGFLPIFKGNPTGIGLLTASLILAVMIVPIITAVSADVLKAVPASLREAAFAMGATDWEATQVVLGAARSGLTGAVILGLGRAVGETMAVTMLIGNSNQISVHLFEPSNSIAAAIANQFSEAMTDMHQSALVELALILFVITFVVNTLARLMIWTITRGQGTVPMNG